MEPRERLLPLVGAYNFRDLGGYPTIDGRATRWGRLFRSDTLHERTEEDVKLLRDVGLATVIDLRMPSEVQRNGRGRLEAEPVKYLHLSVIDEDKGESQGIPAPTDDLLAKHYLWYLDIGREALAEALRTIGNPASYPLVFHCAAGKDRTGVLAALVLALLGIRRELIIEDYVLTTNRMELIVARFLRNAGDTRTIDELPAKALTLDAAAMNGFLEGLDARHGGARQWALSAGVSDESLGVMSAVLLEKTDE